MIKVTAFALYGSQAASTRVRFEQFIPALAERGIILTVSPLLDNEYLNWRFSGGPLPVREIVASALNRVQRLRRADFDIAIVHCELFPLMPAVLENATLAGRPFIYDFDDAFYLKYQSPRFSLIRPALGRKFDAVIARAVKVHAGNAILAEYARQFSSSVRIVPSVVDTHKLGSRTGQRQDGVFTIGWIGSPSTAKYLGLLREPLQRLGREGLVRLVVVGGAAPTPALDSVEVREVRWSEAKERDDIAGFDVGVMPLFDDAWSRGKCAFKLIQYMACGVPVVASPVGANRSVVTPECGFLANSDSAWLAAFRRLRDDPQLRTAMGRSGRERVKEHYSIDSTVDGLAQSIVDAVQEWAK